MKSLPFFLLLTLFSLGVSAQPSWIDDSLLWVKKPMVRSLITGHFAGLRAADLGKIGKDLTRVPEVLRFNDTMFVYQSIFRKVQVQGLSLVKGTPEGDMVFVHISAVVSRRLPYDRLRAAKMRAWADKQGIDTRRYMAFVVEEKAGKLMIATP
ncbi:MAG: hypothetical protein OHK0039_11830 [Bacteroidia bacterium]